MALVRFFPVASVFFAIAVGSALVAAFVFLIRPSELLRVRETRVPGCHAFADSLPAKDVVQHHCESMENLQSPHAFTVINPEQRFCKPSAKAWHPTMPVVRFRELLCDGRVAVLLASAALFHLANAPVMPLVAQKVAYVGGSNSQVAGVVLTAQAVMIPAALLAGWLGDSWGRKPVFAVGFIVLPLRIALYALTNDPRLLVILQALDGIGAGIFGVTAVAMCADLTRGRGHFNALVGVLATAGGLGPVIGSLAAGIIVQQLGFAAAFSVFAAVAAVGTLLFIWLMPETRLDQQPREVSDRDWQLLPITLTHD
jgi:hypothetical protein